MDLKPTDGGCASFARYPPSALAKGVVILADLAVRNGSSSGCRLPLALSYPP
jgi:hypothetical protein